MHGMASIGKLVLLLVLVLGGVLVIRFTKTAIAHRQWFDLQEQQLQTIKRLEAFPPPGCSARVWESAIVTPYNIWGNVTYHPEYSKISNKEMLALKLELDAIVAETNDENGFESVDRVFDLLLQRGQKIEFISGYRDEIREWRASIDQGASSEASETEPPEGTTAGDP